MRDKKKARARLSYIVPGYVWQQAHFKIDWTDAASIIETGKGIVFIESQSMKMREYAAASLLALLQQRNYHAEIGWTSFYPRELNEFTGSAPVPKHRLFQVIAVKTELDEMQMEQVQDLAVSCDLAIIAAPTLQLTVIHTKIKVNASTGETVNI